MVAGGRHLLGEMRTRRAAGLTVTEWDSLCLELTYTTVGFYHRQIIF